MDYTYKDEALVCAACSTEFIFTAGEQRFYYDEMGWATKPRRCAPCRREANKVRLAARITERGELIENRALLSGDLQTRGQHARD
jgi:hypothetical protein